VLKLRASMRLLREKHPKRTTGAERKHPTSAICERSSAESSEAEILAKQESPPAKKRKDEAQLKKRGRNANESTNSRGKGRETRA